MNLAIVAPVLGLAIVLVAGLLRLRRSNRSVRLRRSVVLYGLYLVLATGTYFGSAFGPNLWLTVLTIATELLVVLLAINLAALLVFDVGLRELNLRIPDIVHDLVVGTAYIIACVWLMHRMGVNLASIVATSAVVTAVIGLSLQPTLGNVIGGLSLQVDNSITEGDWIEMPDKVQGIVRQVRWRHTVVETRDWDTLLIPNNQLLNQTIKVLGRRQGQPRQHRMWVYFHVDFRYSPSQVIRVVDDALQRAPIPNVAASPAAHTICFDLAKDRRESVGYYAVRYFLTDMAVDDPTSSMVRERVYAALRRAQIPLAMPATAVFVSQDDPDRLLHKREREITRVAKALGRVDLFQRLSKEELRQLADSVRVVPFSSGELITRQGAEANWLYVLTKGEVEVRISSGDRDRRVNTLHAPSFFGEMALMTGSPREATVMAVGEVECVRVDRGDFKRLLESRPEIARDAAAVLAERRVALATIKEGLDAEAASKRVEGERHRILTSVQEFFGLKD